MSIRRLIPAAALGVAAVLALAGCAGGATAEPSASNAAPVTGGELVFGQASDPLSLNPSGTGNGNITWYVTRQLVDSLLYQNPDTGALEGWLAESFEPNADSSAFTFHLRDGVTFSDGTPLTAADVKGTFDDIIAAGAPAANTAALLGGYKESVVIDDRTVEVRFSKPNAAFPSATTAVGLGIVGAATRAVPFDQRADGKAVVGTGAFTLQTYTKDVETVLARRDGYAWGPSSLGNAGASYLDSIVFQVLPEASVRTGSLTSGQVDGIGSVLPTDVSELTAQGQDVVYRTNPGLAFGVAFNLARPATSDPVVREALALAVDPTQVRDTAVSDLFPVATSSLAHNTTGYADQGVTTDPTRAASLLDQAGWTRGADGVRQKDGQPLKLILGWATNSASNQAAVELIQQQLAAVGVGVDLVSGTVPELLKRFDSGEFDLAWGNLSNSDGDVLRQTFSSAGINRYRIADPTLEGFLQGQLAASDPAARAAILGQAQARIASQHYYVPVFELTSIIAVAPDVHGVVFGADSRLAPLVGAWKAAS